MKFERTYKKEDSDISDAQRMINEDLYERVRNEIKDQEYNSESDGEKLDPDSPEYVKNSEKRYRNKHQIQIPRSSQDGSRIWYFKYSPNKGLDPFRDNPDYTIIAKDAHYKGKLFKKFSVFYSKREAVIYIKNVPESERVFYDLIQEDQPCRIYLDYDFDITDEEDLDNEIDNRLDELFEVIPVVFKKCFGKNPGKMYVFDSSYETKISFHIEFDRYCVKSNWDIVPFVFALHEAGLNDLDPNVYKRNQQWRCPFSRKLDSPNYKYLVDENEKLPNNRYLITDISKCEFIAPSGKCIEDFERSNVDFYEDSYY